MGGECVEVALVQAELVGRVAGKSAGVEFLAFVCAALGVAFGERFGALAEDAEVDTVLPSLSLGAVCAKNLLASDDAGREFVGGLVEVGLALGDALLVPGCAIDETVEESGAVAGSFGVAGSGGADLPGRAFAATSSGSVVSALAALAILFA
jgi:hypothetical protein